FYGTSSTTVNLTAVNDHNLSNVDVLRRQIEEYAKFRAPVVIFERLMAFFDLFEETNNDKELIEDKMEIDQDLADLSDTFEAIYNQINNVEIYKISEETAFNEINEELKFISEELSSVYRLYVQIDEIYEEASDDLTVSELAELIADTKSEFDARLNNLQNLVVGGTVGSGWNDGTWETLITKDGIETVISDWPPELEWYIGGLETLVTLCKKADRQKESLESKVASLRADISSGKGSEDLRNGLSDMLDSYEDLLAYDLTALSEMYQYDNESSIEESVNAIKGIYAFGTVSNNAVNLHLSNLPFEQLKSATRLFHFTTPNDLLMQDLTNYNDITTSNYSYAQPNKYQTFVEYGGEYEAFYNELDTLFKDSEDDKKLKKNVLSALSDMQKEFKELTTDFTGFNVGGKTSFPSGSISASSSFDTSADWGSGTKAQDSILAGLTTLLGDLADGTINKVLLTVYCTEMFSNYSTNRDKEAKTEVSMAGIPFSDTTNYLYQSEQEYLLVGNKLVDTNLAAVYGMIFLVRFVMNYTATFSISYINNTLNNMKTSITMTIISELLRVALATGESLWDATSLRNSEEVVLMKTDKTWRLSISNLMLGTISGEGNKTDGSVTLSYGDYVCMFLLTKDGDDVARHAAQLMEANVNIYQGVDIGGEGGSVFQMSKAYTDFDIETTVDMKFLFLSMPMAQNFSGGITPPTTYPISASLSRGY
ncbi:MAG: DUF5702 domain-containing protein, partial [Eubacteriales bacterium]